MFRRAGCLATAAAVAALAVAACGQERAPLRIGVIADCQGINKPLRSAELAGAELPFAQRGGTVIGGDPVRGVSPATVGGRRVELVQGCTEVFEFSTLTAEVRRLILQEHVHAIVAGAAGADEIVLRDLARRFPRVVFAAAATGPRDVTLHAPAPNLYRVAPDEDQGVAGLATYAYRTLGWRRVAVTFGDWDVGWGARDAFVAEFCALGGRVTDQIASTDFSATPKVSALPRDVDGFAVFAPALFGPGEFLTALARHVGDPARRMVVGPSIVDDPDILRAARAALSGVVGSSAMTPDAVRAYGRAMAATFPGIPADTARGQLVVGYRNAVELVMRGLDRAGGEPARLPAALAGLRTELTGGPLRLDAHGQAVVTTSIVRIGRSTGAADPGVTRVGAVSGVDQSVGGLLPPSLVTRVRKVPCARSTPPPWAG